MRWPIPLRVGNNSPIVIQQLFFVLVQFLFHTGFLIHNHSVSGKYVNRHNRINCHDKEPPGLLRLRESDGTFGLGSGFQGLNFCPHFAHIFRKNRLKTVKTG
nr:MAG TPA: hypothetical protein [Caudoviricetes sp.]